MEQLNLKGKDKTLQFVIKHPCGESYKMDNFDYNMWINKKIGSVI